VQSQKTVLMEITCARRGSIGRDVNALEVIPYTSEPAMCASLVLLVEKTEGGQRIRVLKDRYCVGGEHDFIIERTPEPHQILKEPR
jgi:hypothetical protein